MAAALSAEVEGCIGKLDRAASHLNEHYGSAVKGPRAELEVQKACGEFRDSIHEHLQKTGGDRSKLLEMYGGSDETVARILAILAGVDASLAAGGRGSQRHSFVDECRSACELLGRVLRKSLKNHQRQDDDHTERPAAKKRRVGELPAASAVTQGTADGQMEAAPLVSTSKTTADDGKTTCSEPQPSPVRAQAATEEPRDAAPPSEAIDSAQAKEQAASVVEAAPTQKEPVPMACEEDDALVTPATAEASAGAVAADFEAADMQTQQEGLKRADTCPGSASQQTVAAEAAAVSVSRPEETDDAPDITKLAAEQPLVRPRSSACSSCTLQ
eukprot:TRINITY_DN5286_c0_g1_i1.p1 TRINITY_DN5286_c0_g1~~TRINITY_DN5286_c0_g1_i1.p1  ORF type:complete len:329 (+),score=90.79 TRINITY_DN5286_c0_g1_i1:71-1057(+)